MKIVSLLLGAIVATGLAVSMGCETDIDTASSQPPVIIENRYEDRESDVRYGVPERDRDVRVEADRDTERDVDIDEDIDIDIDRDIDRDVDVD